MKQVVIVIPIYKKEIGQFEKVSLLQCLKILNDYPITLVCSKTIDVSAYLLVASNVSKSILVERFDDKFFMDIQGYNKLMLSINFYRRFRIYEYMLIYQTDAYVFRDELTEWCNMNYDYIGAPWLMNISDWLTIPGIYPKEIQFLYKFIGNYKMSKTGNGGLSLRKIRSFISSLFFFGCWAKKWTSNEDNFYSHCINILNPFFKIAPLEKSLQFSFDSMPEKALEINKSRLPFGCHGWYRTEGHYINNLPFWNQFIKIDSTI